MPARQVVRNIVRPVVRSIIGSVDAVFPPLDSFDGAALGYSLARKLRTAYSGSAFRVRRSNDNAEQDIGFTASGLVDEAALTTFVGTNDGHITTIYDQSGNALNATQTTAGNQPRIVVAGAVRKENGWPSLLFASANSRFFSLASAVGVLNNVTGAQAFFALKWTDATEDAVEGVVTHFATGTAAQSANPRFRYGRAASSPSDRMLVRRLDADTSTQRIGALTTPQILQATVAETDFAGTGLIGIKKNSGSLVTAALPATGNTSATNSTFAFLGCSCNNAGTPSSFWDGSLSEFILYANNTDFAARRAAVQANQISFYGI